MLIEVQINAKSSSSLQLSSQVKGLDENGYKWSDKAGKQVNGAALLIIVALENLEKSFM